MKLCVKCDRRSRLPALCVQLNVDPLEVEAAKLELEHPSEVKLAMSVLKFPDVRKSFSHVPGSLGGSKFTDSLRSL